MSTSNDPTAFMIDLSKQPDELGQFSALSAGMPDPAILTKLANDFFREPSLFAAQPAGEQGVKGGSSSNQSSLLSMPANIPTDASSIDKQMSEQELQALAKAVPASMPAINSQMPGQQELTSLLSSPFGSAGTFSTNPSFAFLEEARGLFTQLAGTGTGTNLPGMPSMPVVKVPASPDEVVKQSESRLKQTVPGSSFSVPRELQSPSLPGVPTSLQEMEKLSYGFLSDIKPLGPIEVLPTLAPFEQSLGSLPSAMDISSTAFDVNSIRRDFPILNEKVNGKQLIWLDNAATTQKPQSVIDRLSHFYAHENSNIHRAAHTLAARATDAYEAAREKTRRFLNAGSVNEIIFVRGTTEGINLIAQSFGRRNVMKDDEIVITHLEHHANIVPWQMLCSEKGAKLKVAPVDNTGQIILEEYEKLLNHKTKIVSISQVSNALGTITPVNEMTAMAHRHGAKVIVDGAQAVSHMQVDVQEIDCDFYVFSGHKVFAPTGIGAVYGKQSVLEQTPPWQGGGNMISDVTFEKTIYHGPPLRFEAGTGNIADAVGLGAAIDYVERVGMANISRYEHDLLGYATEAMKTVPGLHFVGTAVNKASVLSFVLDGYRSEDVGAALSLAGIAVRSGHHCAQPILRRFGLETTVRPSLAFYNTCEEVDVLVASLWNLKQGRHIGVA
jgi:cysteine desulfurase/selenocysteine lyase